MRRTRHTPEPLVGRDHVTARLTQAIDDVLAGDPRLVLVEGEAGIGKSRILRWLRDASLRRGLAVASGTARELEQHQRPLGPLIDALEPLTDAADAAQRELSSLLARSGPSYTGEGDAAMGVLLPTSDARGRLLAAMTRALLARSAARPLALLLDDLQWVDGDTVEVLRMLLHRPGNGRLLMVCAYRPSPRPRPLLTLPAAARRESIVDLNLGPLDASAVEELVAASAGARPGGGLLRVVAGARGNPFFVRELVAALQDDGRIESREGSADVADPGLPPSLRTTVIRRMAALPERTQQALRWASILGSSFAVADLATVTGRELPEVIDVLRPALDARVLTDAGARLAFRHDLVHEAIYSDMPAGLRAAHHLHAARSLAATGASALVVAPHYGRGAQGHEREAARWLKRAADEVELRSPGTAAGLLRQALELTPASHSERADALFGLVRAMLWSGDWRQAEEEARTALERDDGASIDGALRYVMARALIYRGRTMESVVESRKALEHDLPPRDRARLLADLTLRLPLLGELADGESAATQAIALARRHDDRFAISTALSGLSLISCLRGQPQRALEIAESALPRGDGSISESVEFHQPYFYYSMALLENDEYERVADVLLRLRRRTDEMGMRWARGLTEGLIVNLEFRRGRWADALLAASTWQDLAEETDTRVWMVLVQSVALRIATHRGDIALAEATAASLEAHLADAGSHHLGMEQWWLARALLSEAQGDPDAALASLRDAWRVSAERGFVSAQIQLGPDLARLAAGVGRRDLARDVARSLSATAHQAASPTYTASASRAQGWANQDAGAMLDAAGTYERAGRPLEASASLEDAAALKLIEGDSKEASALLGRALDGYEGVGAGRDAARVVSSLRSLGVTRGVRRPRRRPDSGWAALSETERKVVRLAAEGLTNREIGARLFISHRTVATHLAHTFAKLGVSSRVELAAAAARNEGVV